MREDIQADIVSKLTRFSDTIFAQEDEPETMGSLLRPHDVILVVMCLDR